MTPTEYLQSLRVWKDALRFASENMRKAPNDASMRMWAGKVLEIQNKLRETRASKVEMGERV